MLRRVIVAALGGWLLTAAAPQRLPVLVELFTSEGCSSCPPADRVLEALDPSTIVLSEHVDYWDHLGWRDPFSSHATTLRQEAYARRFSTKGPYTPQMVIDGSIEFNGSDGPRALAEIERSAKREKVEVRLARTDGGLKIETGTAARSADIMLALAEDTATSQVASGENGGRKLHHVAILRSLRKVGTVKRGAPANLTVPLNAAASGQRVIVFLQESDLGRVSGAGSLVPQTVTDPR
jgi:hypothetical protein